MSERYNVVGDILFELDEIKKVEAMPETDGSDFVTHDYGGILSLICC